MDCTHLLHTPALLFLSSPDNMIFFNVFSTAIICLWSLLLATGPIYIPVFTIPALVPPVLTPLLSPQNGRIILILTEVCDAAISLPFPTCDPSEVPIYSSGSHGTLSDLPSSFE